MSGNTLSPALLSYMLICYSTSEGKAKAVESQVRAEMENISCTMRKENSASSVFNQRLREGLDSLSQNSCKLYMGARPVGDQDTLYQVQIHGDRTQCCLGLFSVFFLFFLLVK